jgi:hypothetical protein
MNRRDAIARLALIMGGAIVGSESFLRGSPLPGKQTAPGFSADELALMDEIGDTIIPATATPGAKAVQIGAFMAMMVNDCYDDENHAFFKAGLGQLDDACRKQYGKSFRQSSPQERTTLLNSLDAEGRKQSARKTKNAPAHYFQLMKELTILGYFTSEIGASQALRYVEVPGSFNGNVPYKKGDRAWFVAPNHGIRS